MAIVGHIDEIGLIVSHIDDSGFLRFIGVGGWDAQILVGQRVEVITRQGPVPGVVGKKPIHLLRDEDRAKAADLKELHIDIGAADAAEAGEHVRIGDVAVLAGEPLELLGDRAVSRAMDNRLGAYIALEAARLVAEDGGAPGDVAAVGVVQEEITFGGSRTSTFRLQPGVAIVVDVTHETSAPGIEVNQIGKHEFGSGPVIERGSVLHPVVFELLHSAAEKEKHFLHGAGLGAHRREPTPTPSTCSATACRPAASRSRCATCTRRWRWCRSRTSTRARASSPRSRDRWAPRRRSRAEPRAHAKGAERPAAPPQGLAPRRSMAVPVYSHCVAAPLRHRRNAAAARRRRAP